MCIGIKTNKIIKASRLLCSTLYILHIVNSLPRLIQKKKKNVFLHDEAWSSESNVLWMERLEYMGNNHIKRKKIWGHMRSIPLHTHRRPYACSNIIYLLQYKVYKYANISMGNLIICSIVVCCIAVAAKKNSAFMQ